ncbi:hypothetical protein ScPMuIL_009899 [Solemya velum]
MGKSKEEEANAKAVDTIEEGDQKLRKRETWTNPFDFLLACIGFSVGLGNVWRFPYLCYKNGGGAFLIPYLICVFVGGIPLFFLEVAVGQFMGKSGLGAWNICPIFQGIGIATTIIVFFLNCYYNVILAWAFYYMFASMQSVLPWSDCGHEWNTENCHNFDEPENANITLNGTVGRLCNATFMNFSSFMDLPNTTYCNESDIFQVDPVTEYWENKVLAISDGIDQMGPVKWDICLCLLFAWIVVYLCICKGIKSSGKVMYVTATSPYIFMTCLLIRNSLLDGAGDGVLYYLQPNVTKLMEIQVWVDAGTQIFFSYSISLGALTALGSYNLFNHNCVRDSLIFAFANSGTSIFAGFIIFTILGYMAKVQNKAIKDVAAGGPGLAFIAYPKALTQMPGAPAWSVLFFLMVILLGLDSQFVGVEGVITAIVDQWPHILRVGHRREMFIAVVCFISFLVGLPMVTNGGMYVFQLFDYYSGSRIILFVAFFECVAVAWLYGIRRMYDNIEMMIGKTKWFKYVFWTLFGGGWIVLSPLFCMTVFVMSAYNYSELTYERPGHPEYIYPQWAIAIGWTMAGLSAVFIPGVAIYKILQYGFVPELIKPYGLEPHQLRPQDFGERTLDDYEPKFHLGETRRRHIPSERPNVNKYAQENPAFTNTDHDTRL